MQGFYHLCSLFGGDRITKSAHTLFFQEEILKTEMNDLGPKPKFWEDPRIFDVNRRPFAAQFAVTTLHQSVLLFVAFERRRSFEQGRARIQVNPHQLYIP